jgi:outer membrane autotransporter protein
VSSLTMATRRWAMRCAAMATLVLGFWQAHVDAQQVTVNANVNVELMNQYLIDACLRLRLAGGNSSSSSSNSTGSSGPILDTVVDGVTTALAQASPLALTLGQTDLLTRCQNIAAVTGQTGDVGPLNAINGADLSAVKLDVLLFADANNAALGRMRDLRAAQGAATANSFDLRYNDMALFAADVLHRGGGASADTLSSPWGAWGRINRGSGDKDTTALTGPLKMDHSEFTLGMDYRSGGSILGGSIALRDARLDFGGHGERGGLDGHTTTLSAYGSSYLVGNLYVDGILNYGYVSYDSTRRIAYDEFGSPIDRTALGTADGRTFSAGGSFGYDLASGGFTLTPSLSYFYIDARIDPFAERGAEGLNLAFSEQRYRSSSARVQLSSAYAISTRHGVLSPYMRAAFVKEFKDDVDTFGARFVDDPDAGAGVPVTVEALDNAYYRLGVGMSAQFQRDTSAYLDYQQVSGFQSVSFWSATLGLRRQF